MSLITQAFLEAGPSYPFGVFEEAVIGFVEALYHVLDGLRAEALPGGVSSSQPGDVLHQAVGTDSAAIALVVAPCEGYRVVPDRGCDVDLFDEFVVVLVGVEAVFNRCGAW